VGEMVKPSVRIKETPLSVHALAFNFPCHNSFGIVAPVAQGFFIYLIISKMFIFTLCSTIS
jgi:hypothetical protein